MGCEFDADYATEQLARRNNPLRRLVKRAYLRNTLREVDGATVDLGCGAGQLLERLPPGSVGLEVNPALVSDLQARGLDVRPYDGLEDDFRLSGLTPGRYRTLLASHVIEHFDCAGDVLRRIARSCERLGIARIVLVLPGWRGFLTDSTHKTFVDQAYLKSNGLHHLGGFELIRFRCYPLPWEGSGRIFVYNECIFVWAWQGTIS